MADQNPSQQAAAAAMPGGPAPTGVPVVNIPPDATHEGHGEHINVHPMSCELKHLTIGALVGLVIGLFVGYFEMNRRAGATWTTVAGFAIGGLLLGLGIGFAIPARKKVVHKGYDGKSEVYYCD